MRVVVLVHGDIQNDYRVLKTVDSISNICQVDLFFISEDDSSNINLDIQLNENIQIFPIKKRESIWRKILRHSFFTFEYNYLIKAVKQTNHIYTHIWSNDLTTLVSGKKLSKKFKAKLIYDSHEIFIETLNQFFPRKSTGLKKGIFRFLLFVMKSHGKSVENRIISKVDTFVTVNESILSYFYTIYDIPKGVVLMNLPKLNIPPCDPIDLRKDFSWKNDSKLLLYQGVLNEGRGLWLLLDVMLALEESYKLVIIGYGTLYNDLKEICLDKRLKNRVKFIGKVKLDILPKYTKSCDIGINILEDFNLSKKMASPNKLFEYIHANIPVISTNTIENSKVINNPTLGVLVENNLESIVSAIHKFFERPSKDLTVFNKTKQKFSWENQEYKFNKILD